jgi:hypothetical protein
METFTVDKESAERAKATISDPLAEKKWPKFEISVTDNPFYHPKHRRIVKLEKGTGFPPGCGKEIFPKETISKLKDIQQKYYCQPADVIECGFNLAYQIDCVYWGINLNDDSRSYYQYKPFSLTGPVLGPFSAHLRHNVFYDERLFLKEDYDISIQLLSKYKKILRINKYACSCKHADNPGGVVSHRTMDRERQQCEAIMRKWGKDIIKYKLPGEKMSDLLNGSVNIPIKGV